MGYDSFIFTDNVYRLLLAESFSFIHCIITFVVSNM